MLLAVLISTLVQIMYMADVMTAFFTVYNNGLPQDPDLVIRNEQILKKYIKRYDWIQLNTYVYCCGLVTVDDLFGNLTEWQGPSCSNPHASSCVEIIPPIIKELDMEFLITCFNFLVMVVTLAYSFYYLLCFDQILFVRDGKRKESPNQETDLSPSEMGSFEADQLV
ncbi:hypothetical protein WA588_003315 [Blastocystis sp. NMH]